MSETKAKNDCYKFPGLVETCNFRKSSSEFAWGIVTPQKYYESHVVAVMAHLSRVGVFYFIPCTTIEQVEALIAQDIDVPTGNVPISQAISPDGERASYPPAEVAELAEWLCMTERNVQILETRGVVFKVARGKYDLKESVKGYIREMNAKGDGKNSDYHQERVRIIRAKRVAAELDNLERSGSLVNAAEAKRLMEKVFGAIRQRLLMMPKFLAPRIEGLTANEIEGALDDYARDSLTQLAQPALGGQSDSGGASVHGAAAKAHAKQVGRRKKKAKRKKRR